MYWKLESRWKKSILYFLYKFGSIRTFAVKAIGSLNLICLNNIKYIWAVLTQCDWVKVFVTKHLLLLLQKITFVGHSETCLLSILAKLPYYWKDWWEEDQKTSGEYYLTMRRIQTSYDMGCWTIFLRTLSPEDHI